MAKRQVTDCDRCGTKGVPTREVCVEVAHYTDAAGSSDTDQRTFDLCGPCLALELGIFLDRINHVQARQWVKRVTGKTLYDHRGRIFTD